MRIFGLLGLIIGVAIVVFFTVDRFEMLGGGSGNPKQSVNEAETVAAKANLDAISKKLNVYYIENAKYPDNLNELGPDAQDFSVFEYQLCGSDKAIVKLGSTTMLLTNGNAVLDDSASCL